MGNLYYILHGEHMRPISPTPMMQLLEQNRIVGIDLCLNGNVEVFECCDHNFIITLTPTQLLALAKELESIANSQAKEAEKAEEREHEQK